MPTIPALIPNAPAMRFYHQTNSIGTKLVIISSRQRLLFQSV